ncbi:MAG: VIT1/CCC1 transporter family protein [Sulfolobaceae archaeon]|nr:VIT1/CCC1 transporter family protein [Sulfolobaceae archaeon]
MEDYKEIVIKNYYDEAFDEQLYVSLSKIEKNPRIRDTLIKLAEVEKKHKNFWMTLAREKGVMVKERKPSKLRIGYYMFLRKALGVYLMSKLLERKEWSDWNKYMRLSKYMKDEKERQQLIEIANDEMHHEEMIASSEVSGKTVGDFIYGISDGLVEVLAAVSGLAGLFKFPIYIALGGLIVGLSGTMSMSIGAYLSTESEKDIEASNTSPGKSALITGVSYITGAIVPILPFLFSIGGLMGLLTAYLIAGITTFIVGYLTGLMSNVNPYRKGLKMLALALSAAIATHLIGIAVSAVIPKGLLLS